MVYLPAQNDYSWQDRTNSTMNSIALPEGYSFRSTRIEDAEAVARVLSAVEIAETGKTDMTVEMVLSDWADIDLAEEAVVVEDPDGRIVASADLVNRANIAISVYGYVHPDASGKGIGRALVDWGERKAAASIDRAPDNARVTVQHYIQSGNQAARRLLEDAGYPPIRTTFTMEIDMETAPPAPVWPRGISVRVYRPGQDEQLTYDAHEDAFRDLWGRPKNSYDRFLKLTQAESFDPDLWFLAEDAGRIAGVSLCKLVSGQGIVESLGVLRPWRGRGLGLALLQHSFGAFWNRGVGNVWLSVDAESLTGATRLYERAGMHVTGRYIIHLKELRPGVDYSQHALEE
jgi:mycothiol synthase